MLRTYVYICKEAKNRSALIMALTSDNTVLQCAINPKQVTSSAVACRQCVIKSLFSPKSITTQSFTRASYVPRKRNNISIQQRADCTTNHSKSKSGCTSSSFSVVVVVIVVLFCFVLIFCLFVLCGWVSGWRVFVCFHLMTSSWLLVMSPPTDNTITTKHTKTWAYSWAFYQHDDVIKWKNFPRSWPFVRGIHRSPVNSPHKGQWRRALMFCLICSWINGSVNNRVAGDLRRHRAHYDVTVMIWASSQISNISMRLAETEWRIVVPVNHAFVGLADDFSPIWSQVILLTNVSVFLKKNNSGIWITIRQLSYNKLKNNRYFVSASVW